jgi:hypothetical protein
VTTSDLSAAIPIAWTYGSAGAVIGLIGLGLLAAPFRLGEAHASSRDGQILVAQVGFGVAFLLAGIVSVANVLGVGPWDRSGWGPVRVLAAAALIAGGSAALLSANRARAEAMSLGPSIRRMVDEAGRDEGTLPDPGWAGTRRALRILSPFRPWAIAWRIGRLDDGLSSARAALLWSAAIFGLFAAVAASIVGPVLSEPIRRWVVLVMIGIDVAGIALVYMIPVEGRDPAALVRATYLAMAVPLTMFGLAFVIGITASILGRSALEAAIAFALFGICTLGTVPTRGTLARYQRRLDESGVDVDITSHLVRASPARAVALTGTHPSEDPDQPELS